MDATLLARPVTIEVAADYMALRSWQNSSKEINLHEELLDGVLLKVEYASFHFERMGQSIQPERAQHSLALEAAGMIVESGWQRSFYPHFDAFLSAARSVPEILQCCFGHDPYPRMRAWFDALPADERDRRKEFSARFAPALKVFRALDLGTARHVSEHRRGFAQVDVAISDLFGVVRPSLSAPAACRKRVDLD